jgi:hypothetical protein
MSEANQKSHVEMLLSGGNFGNVQRINVGAAIPEKFFSDGSKPSC